MHYIDETSEYPLVNKCDKYPVGHLHIFTNSEIAEISHYYGMAKVNILPPYKVFNLALPYRRSGKLTFLLCCTCVCLRALVRRGHGESYFASVKRISYFEII